MRANEPARALEALGFTPLEAEVYVQLLQRPASTGYRLAQHLGKAAAGIYKALDSLARKGAVVVDDDDTKSWRAVPPTEVLALHARQEHARREEARLALASLEQVEDDARIYRLSTFDQVLERARSMLQRAEEVAVVDLFPSAVELVRADVAAAQARGVRVLAKLYAPDELEVAYRVVTPDADRLLSMWTADWLNVVVDAREHLLALLDCGKQIVHHATWSRSSYLSLIYYSGITAEIQMDALGGGITAGSSLKTLRELRAMHLATIARNPPPGARELMGTLSRPTTQENTRK